MGAGHLRWPRVVAMPCRQPARTLGSAWVGDKRTSHLHDLGRQVLLDLLRGVAAADHTRVWGGAGGGGGHLPRLRRAPTTLPSRGDVQPTASGVAHYPNRPSPRR